MLQKALYSSKSALKPARLTSMMAALGLLPAALSHAVGAETARPFAMVIVGSLTSVTPLTLVVLPVAMTLPLPLTRRNQAAEPALGNIGRSEHPS